MERNLNEKMKNAIKRQKKRKEINKSGKKLPPVKRTICF
jgi:hypothetical protein